MQQYNKTIQKMINFDNATKENIKEFNLSLAKWLSVRLRTKWLWVRVQLQSVELQISCLF